MRMYGKAGAAGLYRSTTPRQTTNRLLLYAAILFLPWILIIFGAMITGR